MIFRFLNTRIVCILAATAALALLSGCCDGSCPDTTHSSRATTKDGKETPMVGTSGPHQNG